MNSVAFVIPTKNEEKTLSQVLEATREECSKLGISIEKIFIADDSRDQTRVIAKREGVEVVSGGGYGLGEAMFRGLKRAAMTQADYIVSIDADGQTNLRELASILHPLQEGVADLVLSSRCLKAGLVKYRYPLINAFGRWILIRLLRWGTGLALTDSHGGLRAMVRPVAEELEMIGIYTYVQETIFDAHQKGYRIVEVPGEWFPREGKSRVLVSIPKYIFYTLPVIIVRCGYHMTHFLPLFLLLIILGVSLLIVSLGGWAEATREIFIIAGEMFSLVGFFGVGSMVMLELFLTGLRHARHGR